MMKDKLSISTKSNFFENSLIAICSILIGIWATRGTIAFRNILLYSGWICCIVLFYLYSCEKKYYFKLKIKYLIPTYALILLYFWAVFHLFFITDFYDNQIMESKGVALRCVLGLILGFCSGIILRERPRLMNIIFLGSIASFFFIDIQYVINIVNGGAHQFNGDGNFIYLGKMSGALIGTLLLSYLFGVTIDCMYRSLPNLKNFIYLLISLNVVLVAFVYIFNTRIGMIVVLINFIIYCFFIFSYQVKKCKGISGYIFPIILFSCIIILLTIHLLGNPSWSSFQEEFFLAIDGALKYINSPNSGQLTLPQRNDGHLISGNIFDRILFITLSIKELIPNNPWGIGRLNDSFGTLMKMNHPELGNLISSHSAIIDLTLAYGYVGGFFLIISFIGLVGLAIKTNSQYCYTAILMSLNLALIYSFGEVGSKHSLEIMFFLIPMINILAYPERLHSDVTRDIDSNSSK